MLEDSSAVYKQEESVNRKTKERTEQLNIIFILFAFYMGNGIDNKIKEIHFLKMKIIIDVLTSMRTLISVDSILTTLN